MDKGKYTFFHLSQIYTDMKHQEINFKGKKQANSNKFVTKNQRMVA